MHNTYIYILCMAAVTYLIRVLPLTLIRKPIKNKRRHTCHTKHYEDNNSILHSDSEPLCMLAIKVQQAKLAVFS